jgi:hypothetical protein
MIQSGRTTGGNAPLRNAALDAWNLRGHHLQRLSSSTPNCASTCSVIPISSRSGLRYRARHDWECLWPRLAKAGGDLAFSYWLPECYPLRARMGVDPSLLTFQAGPPQRKRAEEVIDEFRLRYKLAAHKFKEENKGKALNAMCSVGQFAFDLHTVRPVSDDSIYAVGKSGDKWILVVAPVEQFAFAIVVSPETQESQESPRNIGFGKVPAEKEPPFWGQTKP